MRNSKFVFLVAVCLILTVSCEPYGVDKARDKAQEDYPNRKDDWFDYGVKNQKDDIDPYGRLSRDDYQSIGQQRKIEANVIGDQISLPEIEDLIEQPEEVGIADDKLVSISVNDNIPIKEVLIELARKAEVDVEIDRDITGSIIMIVKEKPFSEVIKRIAKKADLKYSFDDGILKIERDKPEIKTYKFSVLDITRTSQSSVNSNFSVGGTSDSAGSSASITSGSTSTLDTKSGEGDLWSSAERGITEILSKYKAVENDEAAPISESAILSINRNAGMISVLATNKQHSAIKEYLDSLHISLSSQVLIEAKIMEVQLNDNYNSGINWNALIGGVNGVYLGNNFGASRGVSSAFGTDPAISDINTASGGTDGQFKFSVLPNGIFGGTSSLDASVELLEKFGVTRSLSNPRISTMNNQYAVLNFSQNEVYFEVTLEEENDEDGNGGNDTTLTVESEIKTVPIGIILALQPSIDLQRSEITMNIRPTLTRIAGSVDDPGVSIIANRNGQNIENLDSAIPIVEVREIDTVLKLGSSEIMVIGGLLEERVNNTDTGVPGVSSIPFFGNAFKKVAKETVLVETVIFIKATIVPGSGVSVEDKAFYEKFSKAKNNRNSNF